MNKLKLLILQLKLNKIKLKINKVVEQQRNEKDFKRINN